MNTLIGIAIAVVAVLALRYFCLTFLVRTLLRLARLACGTRQHSVLVDGVRWHYLSAGNPNKPAMLLLHGFGADKDNWLAYCRQLADDFYLIAPDIQGFGESYVEDMAGDYSITTQVERVYSFTRQIGLGNFHIAGNSMGGFIAAEFALKYPEAIATLTLMDAAGLRSPVKTSLFEAYDQGKILLLPHNRAEVIALSKVAMAKPLKLPNVMLDYLLAEVQARRPMLEKLFKAVMQAHNASDLSDRLATLKIPTLVIWGRQDAILDVSAGQLLAQKLPLGELAILDGVGHVPMVEAAGATATLQRNFIHKQWIGDTNND